MNSDTSGYAGFWQRFAAITLDGIIFVGVHVLALIVCRLLFRFLVGVNLAWLFGCAAGIIINWLYCVLLESSPKQATLGKMAVGIYVTDIHGNRLSFDRASGRFLGKSLSALIGGVGFVMAIFTQRKQGLHDMLAGSLVVRKGPPTRMQTADTIFGVVLGSAILIFGGFLLYVIPQAIGSSGFSAMDIRAKDIYVAIINANSEREPLGLGTVWPKSGKPMEDAKDIGGMTFANSSDYFTVLYDGEHYGTPEWAPYVTGFDYSTCAGAGVPPKTGGGRLTAQNNAWTIAANITDDMPDIIQVIVSRNVDPSSLIPREGDLRKQFLRPSKHTAPFGDQEFLFVRKGGSVFHLRGKHVSLYIVYNGANNEELQRIRDAFEKVEYLAP